MYPIFIAKYMYIFIYFQTSDIVLHYTSGKMDRFSQQVVDLTNQDDLNDDP